MLFELWSKLITPAKSGFSILYSLIFRALLQKATILPPVTKYSIIT